ncbi:thymine dioxygenase [Gymnopilus junonius]|uniref:Thymine dioxygenase n=1 Tax=Gymnopilus junonius TaxID=109634 RepID=A0A9P5NC39_GYMJU|nr:thymine dioxygenase [Gymnopilus junonius]
MSIEVQGVADAILTSFQTTGFVYLISAMFEWSNKLFSQPTEVKQLAPHPASGAHHRGYSSPGREKVTQLSPDADSRNLAGQSGSAEVERDIKESFEVGRDDMEEMPNIWFPDGVLPGFKEACLDFYWTCYETEKVILRALALGFHLPETFFLHYHSEADNQLRLLHYPSIPAKVLEDKDASRIPSHTDFCSLTMLIQDNIGGLEVEDPNRPNVFIPVPPVEGSIVVNAGDFLMRWSNDTIKSTVHRVRAPLSIEGTDGVIPSRYSIPYDMNTVVDSIPGTWSETRPKRYSPISAREYVTERLAANY